MAKETRDYLELLVAPAKVYRVKRDQNITLATIGKLVNDHTQQVKKRERKLKDAYETKYEIFDITKNPKKDYWKPDNRLAVNFAKQVTDIFTGFFAGIPVRMSSVNENVNNYLQLVNIYNDIDDHDDVLPPGSEANDLDKGVIILFVAAKHGFLQSFQANMKRLDLADGPVRELP